MGLGHLCFVIGAQSIVARRSAPAAQPAGRGHHRLPAGDDADDPVAGAHRADGRQLCAGRSAVHGPGAAGSGGGTGGDAPRARLLSRRRPAAVDDDGRPGRSRPGPQHGTGAPPDRQPARPGRRPRRPAGRTRGHRGAFRPARGAAAGLGRDGGAYGRGCGVAKPHPARAGCPLRVPTRPGRGGWARAPVLRPPVPRGRERTGGRMHRRHRGKAQAVRRGGGRGRLRGRSGQTGFDRHKNAERSWFSRRSPRCRQRIRPHRPERRCSGATGPGRGRSGPFRRGL
ncbi:hypothetical protein SAMN05428954_5849 [Streptomyces sp. 2112.3]|nr:hypothetical protein BX261_1430 [Streptomyces sp. 2321.6]SDR54332.1 hypothetical protein SAMN05216511_5786 [Streptomyces sp. KS_16]SEC20196.1 hypothetical protein SAMN05428940_1430 [Streptomyces sp. 2133.1]SEF06940.1 hypothetical protein SAMN05428954_5849 [Streptomyces sp. 2112.3]SNC65809.1 hypothetical protein SAMN06272741_1428 [Streptomyces sp. 2114.4]